MDRAALTALLSEWGQPAYRARQAIEAQRSGADAWAEVSTLPAALRGRLDALRDPQIRVFAGYAIVFSVAVGNEATVDWTDHFVPVPRMIEHVRRVRQAVAQPVTFCENYVPWQHKLRTLAAELDFISLHTYPVWEYKHVHEALDYTRDNYDSVARLYPGKPVIVTEAGWTTHSNGRGIEPHNTSQELQAIYLQDLLRWTDEAGILCFVFEAFDEPWKGSPDPLEPEKHWGLYTVDRTPKQAVPAVAGLAGAVPGALGSGIG